jgi:signal transduction histidine kinase
MDERPSVPTLPDSARLASLGGLLRDVRHESDNLLAIAGAWMGFLQRPDGSAPVALEPLLGKAASAVERLTRLGKALSLCAAGLTRPVLLDVAVGELTGWALELCAPRVRVRDVELRLDIAAKDVRLRCNPGELTAALAALLGNALDAVTGKPVRLVELTAHADKGDVVFTVTDSGPGIPAAVRERLFVLGTTTKPQGLGLGLALVAAAAAAQGGTAFLDAAHPATRFVVRVPAARASQN